MVSKRIATKTSISPAAPPKKSNKIITELREDEEIEVTGAKPAGPAKSTKRLNNKPENAKAQQSSKVSSEKSKQVAVTDIDSGSGADSEGHSEDQTAALLAGFESSDEENDNETHGVDGPEPEGLSIEDIPKIPDNGKAQKQEKDAPGTTKDGAGVIYIGRIPHGFYEPQMRAYFSQFGKIKRLRLSRNKKTGRSKHYAFIEFASAEVADIVARTMNKYLMFGHILQVMVIPPAQVHEKLFVGANKRFRPVPRNKLEGKRLKEGADREVWAKRVKMEEERRNSRSKKLREMGYEFDFPRLTDVATVPVKDTPGVTEAPEDSPANGDAQLKAAAETTEIEEEDVVKAIEDKPEIASFKQEATMKQENKDGQKSRKMGKKAVAIA
ncbi:MAG: hypothetical protein Q9165_000605 [Trypethelium subeluteriae]